MTKTLEAEWDWAEVQTISKLKSYAKTWFVTLAGAKYKADYEYAL